MRLNGFKIKDYQITDSTVAIFWMYCSLQEAITLEGQMLIVTDDDGEEIAYFDGTNLVSVTKEDEVLRVCFMRELSADTKLTLESIEGTQSVFYKSLEKIKDEIDFQNDVLEEVIFVALGGFDE